MKTAARLALVPLFVPLLVRGALAARDQERPAPRLAGGPHAYVWVPGWGALPEGKALGNTHGCIAIDRDDNVYLCTDTEDADFDGAAFAFGAGDNDFALEVQA